jgi:probable rRNA maturation factor
MLCVEALVTEGDWDPDIGWSGLSDRACSVALSLTPYASLAQTDRAIEVAVRFSSDAEVRQLNATYRDKDKATNVLSFPMLSSDELRVLDGSGATEILLGDIILAFGVVRTEAAEKRISPADHASHLVVHGMLHLLGYDHGSDDEAERMEAIERAAMAALGVADPYADAA